MKWLKASFIFAILTSSTSYADLQIRFIESAPKDIFIIENISNCAMSDFVVDIDLSTSDGGLFFDTTPSGAGVEVFQPFEVRSGTFTVLNDNIADGNDSISLKVMQLASGDKLSFTIDVDDQLRNSDLGQIRVSGSEMNGAQAQLSLAQQTPLTALFSSNNQAVIKTTACDV